MNHSFNTDIAAIYGMPCAVILEHIWFWTCKNEANGKHFHDGLYWTYNSVKAFSKLFPYLTAKQIRTALEKLRAEGLVETGNFNENAYDRTLWYALTEKGKTLCRTGQIPLPDGANPFALQGEPIPDIKPDSVPSINTDEEERAREDDFILNSPWYQFVREYEQNIGLMPTSPVMLGDLQMFFEEFGIDVLSEIIALTARKHPDNPHVYFASICRSWLGKGIKTREQARAAIRDHERRRRGGVGDAINRGSSGESPRRLFDGETVV